MIDLNSFNLQNPWRNGSFNPTSSIPRDILGDVQSWLREPEILVIIGSRQVGKTTLLFQVIEHLLSAAVSKVFSLLIGWNSALFLLKIFWDKRRAKKRKLFFCHYGLCCSFVWSLCYRRE